MRRLAALFLAWLCFAQLALAQNSATIPGGFPQDSISGIDANADIIVYPAYPTAGTYPNNRLLASGASGIITITDNGAGNTLVVDINTITIAKGGTGLTATPTDGQLLIGKTSTNAYVLGTITAGANITVTNGSGTITIASSAGGAPSTATYITQNNETGTLANSSRLAAGTGITLNNATNVETIAVDTTVVLTQTNTITGITNKTFVTPTVSAAQTTGYILAGSAFNDTILITDPAAARTLTIPDPGSAASFVMNAGNSTIAGVKTFSSAPKLSTNTLTTSSGNTVTLVDSTDTLVNLASAQSIVGQKTITTPILNTSFLLQSTANYTINWSSTASPLTYTIPNVGVTASFVLSDGALTYTAGKIAYADGNAIALTATGTSSQALLGGTTPAFGTLPAAGGGTGITTVPAKGSILVGNAGGTAYANLAVGSDTFVLVADSAQTNGVKWAAGGSGVTSVAQSLTGLPFLSISGSPITTSGTLALAASGTTGDLPYCSAANTYSKLAIGSTAQHLTIAAGVPAWTSSTYPTTNSKGDVIVGSGTNAYTSLAVGANGKILIADSTQTNGLAWKSLIVPNYFGTGADGAVTISANTTIGSATPDTTVTTMNYSSLTINSGQTLSAAARDKALLIYVTGNCTINGTLSMDALGASAAASIIDLYKNSVGTISGTLFTSENSNQIIAQLSTDYISAAAGAAGGATQATGIVSNGNPGSAGATNQTGGGGGGAGGQSGAGNLGNGGAGAAGTAYCGGSGGGAGTYTGAAGINGTAGATNGGAGGAAGSAGIGAGQAGGGGAGNSPGAGANGAGGAHTDATGGGGGTIYLIVGGNLTIGGAGVITANGANGGAATAGAGVNSAGGGGAGGGRIVVLYAGTLSNSGTIRANGGAGGTATGGTVNNPGGAGGAGVVTGPTQIGGI